MSAGQWESAARGLEHAAAQLRRLSDDIQAYAAKLRPVADGVTHLIGGSATGLDRSMAQSVVAGAGDLDQAVAQARYAAGQATAAAATAHEMAREARMAEARRGAR